MEDKIKVAGEIAAHTYPLSEKSLCRLAAILEPRKLLKNELFLKEGDVARSMGVVEQGMVRQFYRKKNLEITEHFTYEGHLFVCLESFIRQIDQLYEERRREVLRGVNTYWLSRPLQTAFRHAHSLFLGGGNERSRYGVSINYGANPGIMKGSKRDRLGLNFTWTYSISNKIRIGNMLSVNQTKAADSQYGSFSNYTKINPYERALDEKGRYVYKFSNGEVNPLFNATLNSFSKDESTSYTDNFDVEWYVFDGLRVTGRFSYSFGKIFFTEFR